MAGGFEALGLDAELIRVVKEDLGYLLPTAVQEEAIPLILGGADVMAAAETGSGKTAAFGLPLLQIIHEDLRRHQVSNGKRKYEEDQDGRSGSASSHPSVANAARGTEKGWGISTTDKDVEVAVARDGQACQCRAPKWAGARGNNGVCGGVHHFEATVDDEGLCRFGWATQRAKFNLGTDAFGYGFGGTGMKSHGGQFEKYGEAFAQGDRVGCRLDLQKGEVSFTKNGRELGVAYHLPSGSAGPFFPVVAFKNAQASFNFAAPISGSEASVALASAQALHVVVSSPVAVEKASPRDGASLRTPRAIILEPARELAEQVSECLTSFKRHMTSPSLENALLVGGTDVRRAVKAVKEPCDVVVGTPGRVLDFMEKGTLKTSEVRLLVLDEADRLLGTDSLEQLMKIYNKLPQEGVGLSRLQVCFFSATLHSPEITRLSTSICHRPIWVDLKGRDSVPETVHHVLVRVDPDRDEAALMGGARVKARTDGAAVGPGSEGREEERADRLKRLKPQVLLGIVKALKMDQALIFCRTNLDCDLLEEFLTEVGGGKRYSGSKESGMENAFSCCVLAGMRSMNERRDNLQAFKKGGVRFLICTDVAARGVDIKGLPYVINMTLPDEPENYIHRIGRVGRQDCHGLAVSIVACVGLKEKVWYHKNCAARGRNCVNRKSLAQGGCTIWYDEPSLLEAVESRLHAPIAELGPGYTLPESLARQGVDGAGAPVEYGVTKVGKGGGGAGSGDRARLEEHVRSLRPAVQELAGLEFEAQNIWLGMMHGIF